MKRPYILLGLTFICLMACYSLSCKKEKGKIIINGNVYDPDIKINLSNVHVSISASMITSGYYNSNYTEIASTTTDGDGNFSFNFEREKSAGYRIYIFKDNYFDKTIDIPDADVITDSPYTANYELHPVAYIKLHVKNNSPNNNNDAIRYSYSLSGPDCYDCCAENIISGFGQQYNITTKCKTYGNQNVFINWAVEKAGYNVAFGDTVFCTPFDTTYFEILY